MTRSLQKHLISVACILFSRSAVVVQDSHAYKHIEMTRECISLIFELSAMFLSFHIVSSFESAAIVHVILLILSGFDP